MNGKLNKEKQVENLIKKTLIKASSKLNKYNFKFFSTSLFNNHKVKGIGLITMINWQDTSILAIHTPNPTNPYTKK